MQYQVWVQESPTSNWKLLYESDGSFEWESVLFSKPENVFGIQLWKQGWDNSTLLNDWFKE